MKQKGVPLSKVYDQLKEISRSLISYKIFGGPFEIIDTHETRTTKED